MTDQHTTTTGEPEKSLGSSAATGANLLGSLAAFRDVLTPTHSSNHTFWQALALAVALHGAMFVPLVGFSGNAELQRRMGEADGDPNAINVDVIEQSALPGAGEPAPPPAPPPQEAQPPPQPPPVVMMEPPAPQEPPPSKEEPPKEPVKEAAKEPPKEPAKEPVKQAAAPPEPPVEKPPALPPAGIRGTTDPDGPVAEKPVPAPEAAKDQKAAQTAALMKEMTDLFAPEPPRRNTPQQKQSPAQPTPPGTAPSVLDNPPQFNASSSSFARPVDITRSGENDEFGRGVIRALRQTMPPPLGIKARVTVMFYLTPQGEFAELRLVQGSGYPVVDQSVMFAARNSTFPRPPPGSKNSDRIFLVTYIYD